MAALTIRRGGADDAPRLLTLFDDAVAWLVARGQTGQWGSEPFSAQPRQVSRAQAWAAGGGLWLAVAVAADGSERTAGAIVLGEAYDYVPPPGRPELYVQVLLTAPAWRGRGVGARLIEHAAAVGRSGRRAAARGLLGRRARAAVAVRAPGLRSRRLVRRRRLARRDPHAGALIRSSRSRPRRSRRTFDSTATAPLGTSECWWQYRPLWAAGGRSRDRTGKDMRAESQTDPAEQLHYERSRGLATLTAVLRRADFDTIACRMVDAYCDEIESYARLPHAVLEGRKFDVARSNLELFLDLADKQREIVDEDLEIACSSARADAREGIPLDDLLQAYRIGGMVCWRELIPHGLPGEHFAAVAAGELYVRFAETMSTAVTAAYHDQLGLMGSREDRLQRALYEGIVGEEMAARELRELAEELRFPLLTSYLPFAAAPRRGSAAGLARRLGGDGLLALVDDDERVVGLAPDDGAKRMLAAAGVTFAVGAPVQRSELGAAVEDQRALLDLGLHAGRSGAIGQREFLIERCLVRGPLLGSALEQQLLAPLEEHDRDCGSELVSTLEAFVGVGLSRKDAARTLHIHPNTLDYRLDQINRLTGVRLGQPRDLTLVTLALAQRGLPDRPGAAEPSAAAGRCDRP